MRSRKKISQPGALDRRRDLQADEIDAYLPVPVTVNPLRSEHSVHQHVPPALAAAIGVTLAAQLGVAPIQVVVFGPPSVAASPALRTCPS